jgi:hypothetical protein
MAIKKQKFIDLKELDNLVPKQWRDRINLLFNKDIPKIPNTAEELLIYRAAQVNESQIQQSFHEQFNTFARELKAQNRFNELQFVQIDNGDTAGGKLSEIQRMTLYKRKRAEGSKKGFPDVMIPFYSARLYYRDVVYCEVKKIGAPSEIHLTEEQLDWFLKLNSMGFQSYITNNPIFFKKVILEEIKKYFK